MVHGNFMNGDYFIDCGSVSQSAGRTIFGAWVIVYSTIIATCVRAIYLYRLRSRLATNGRNAEGLSLWIISPILTVTEFFQFRGVLRQVFSQGEFSFILTSLLCVLAAAVGVFNTAIANHTIVSNIVNRTGIVTGWLANQSQDSSIPFLDVNVTSRIQALDHANAPLEELFDFAPDDDSRWLYVDDQWSNSWHGRCTYHLYPAVDLVLYDTPKFSFQYLVPSLGDWLPPWVSDNQTSQGYDIAAIANTGFSPNQTGAWIDSLFTYLFYNPLESSIDKPISSFNISLANFLGHHIGVGATENQFVQTAFRSDVHVAECMFENTNAQEQFQVAPHIYPSHSVVQIVVNVYRSQVTEASLSGWEVIQPTAKQMLRYWQAYMSVQYTFFGPNVQRHLSTVRPVVQIRLSVLAVTLASLMIAFSIVIMSRMAAPRDASGKHVNLPSSQLDWIVTATRQHHQLADCSPLGSSAAFVAEHSKLEYVISLTPDGQLGARIALPGKPPSLMEHQEQDINVETSIGSSLRPL